MGTDKTEHKKITQKNKKKVFKEVPEELLELQK